MRKLSVIAFVIAILVGAPVQAAQTHVVTGDERLGGDPFTFLSMMKIFRDNKVKVIIPEKCISSCTLYTALINDNLICALPGAQFVFHRFNFINDIKVDGTGHLLSYKITGTLVGDAFQRIWTTYPLAVRKWIMAVSPTGLPKWGQEISVEATKLVPAC